MTPSDSEHSDLTAVPDASDAPETVDTIDPGENQEESEPVQDTPLTKEERLNRILKIRLPVIVRVADRRMTIGNILKLSTGSIIQFDKDAYQLIDLMVNNSIIGKGQPIKMGENFGIKIVQIGDITNTIKSLGQ